EAHTPYDPDKIQAADQLVIEELTKLSELKHAYREKNPKPVAATPQDARLLSEIQEQQNLLKTYEVMVKKFQSQIQTRDTEITHLQQQIDEAKLRKSKLEKKLKQRGLLNKESEESDDEENYFSIELTPTKSIWLLHRLAYSFDPKVKVFQVKKGSDFSEIHMESVVKNVILDEGAERPKVGLMVSSVLIEADAFTGEDQGCFASCLISQVHQYKVDD
ncbi:hypothetical protein E2562_003251, partial [Oryza meyeriana var. granulata]